MNVGKGWLVHKIEDTALQYCREASDNFKGKFKRRTRRRINCPLLLWPLLYFSIQIYGQR